MPESVLHVQIGGHVEDLAPGEYPVGRDENSRLRLDDARVSRHHGVISWSGGDWVYRDLDSAHGSWVDGQRVDAFTVTGTVAVHLAQPDGPSITMWVARDIPAQPQPNPRLEIVVDPLRAPTGTFSGTIMSDGQTRIGRAADNDLVLDDILVSRNHAEFRALPDGRLELHDLGSRNGTFVNGQRVRSVVLDDDDLVGIGHSTFRVAAGSLDQFVDTGEITFEAKALTVFSRDGRLLLDDVSFSLKERSLCAVIGPSGSGKSTLLAALSGLRPAQKGQVLYGGRDLYHDFAELRNRIGFVPQEDILHRELHMRQALDYAAQLRFPAGVTRAERDGRIDDVLGELGIISRAAAPVHELSGGERKRTSVALELLTRPSLLFLDEPASGLDPGLTRVLMRMLRELADGGRTIVVVTHELANLALCDQVVVLAPGGVPAYIGPPEGTSARFERADMTDVFSDLSERPELDWRDPSPDQPVGIPATTTTAKPPPPVRQQGWLAQLRTLSARNIAVLTADRRNLAMLALQAPILGVLMLVALPAGELAPPILPEVRLVSTAGLVLFVVLLGATWLGANNAIREIARELPILRRERSVGLSLSAYVVSKVLVFGTLTVLQAAVLVAIATARQRGPSSAVLLGWPIGELMVVVALAGVASMTLALFVSALAGTPERATTILPMLLILQLVLSAGVVLPEIADRPVLREIGYVSSAQWGVAAAASTVDLNELQLFDQRLRDLRGVDATDPMPAVAALTSDAEPEGRWAHETSAWLTAVGVLLGLIVATSVATTLSLRRYDPGR